MTAPDPRLGEIEGRLKAARPGLWVVNDEEQTVRVQTAWGGRWGGEIMYDRSGEHSTEWESEFRSDAEFIAAAPADVAYLLAELRKAQDALGRVEDVLAKKYLLWAAICGNTCSKDILGVDHDAIADEVAAAIRAAVAAATGGERGSSD